ncbi:MAG: FtsH protease activity modulator HflK [Pseudomonadales bacterium]
MGWNEPGGGKDKDPWGNRGGDGPPDLDEAFKKLQNSLTGMFGGGGGGGAGGGGNLPSSKMFVAGLGVLILIWAVMGVYQVDQQERAVVLRFGKALEQVVQPGLHWNPPLIDEVLVANVTQVRSRRHDSEMLTEDENIVRVNMEIQYIIDDVKKYLLEVRSPDESLQQSTESALRHEVGSAKMHSVLTEGRALLGEAVAVRVQRYMDMYGTGILVSKVNVDETAPPRAVQAAFDDVIQAREDEVRFRNEANAYANRVIPEARGEARQLREQAQGYKQSVIARAEGDAQRFNNLYQEYSMAPEVTRERLYLDSLEQVMSNATKVMVDVEGGNNILYLPLDKIVDRAKDQSSSSSSNDSGRSSGNRNSPVTVRSGGGLSPRGVTRGGER